MQGGERGNRHGRLGARTCCTSRVWRDLYGPKTRRWFGMTFPMGVSEQESSREGCRGFDTNPTTAFVPAEVATDKTILVAEDDNNTRRALQHYLKRSGYAVTEAASVDESLEAVFAHPADLVI